MKTESNGFRRVAVAVPLAVTLAWWGLSGVASGWLGSPPDQVPDRIADGVADGVADGAAADASAMARHDELRRELVTLVDALVESLRLPGLAVAVLSEGTPVVVAGTGLADIESGTPLDETTPMRLGPVADTMVATLAAILMDSGRVTWDTTLFEGMPAVRLRDAATTQATRLDALLAHRAGIVVDDRIWSCAPDAERIRTALAEIELSTERAVRESAFSTLAALALLGQRAGTDGPTALRMRLLEPLGVPMAAQPGRPARGAAAHVRTGLEGIAVVADECDAAALWPVRGQWASVASLVPYLTLVAEMGRLDDRRIVSRERLGETMATHDAVAMSSLTEKWMSSGWIVERWRGQRRIGRSGVDGHHAAAIAALPDRRIAVLALTPIGDVGAIDVAVDRLLTHVADVAPDRTGSPIGSSIGSRIGPRADPRPEPAPMSLERLTWRSGPGAAPIVTRGIAIDPRDGGGHSEIVLPGEPSIALLPRDAQGRRAAVAGDMVIVEPADGIADGVLVDGAGPFLTLRRHALPTLLAGPLVDHAAIADAARRWGVGGLINEYRDASGEVAISIGLGAGGGPTLLVQGQVPLTMVPDALAPPADRWRIVGLPGAGVDVERAVDGTPTGIRLVSPNHDTPMRPRFGWLDADPAVAARTLLARIGRAEPPSDPVRLTGTLRMPRQAVIAAIDATHDRDRFRATLASRTFGAVSVECPVVAGERPRLALVDGNAPAGLAALAQRAVGDVALALRAAEVFAPELDAIVVGPSGEVDGGLRVACTLAGVGGDEDLRVVLHVGVDDAVVHALEFPEMGPLIVRITHRTEFGDGSSDRAVVTGLALEHPTLGPATVSLSVE